LAAKLANKAAKKDPASGGVRSLMTAVDQEEALGRCQPQDLWGIAGRLSARLQALGINRPIDLRNADTRFIRERFGVVTERMVHELRGVSCLRLDEVAPDRRISTPVVGAAAEHKSVVRTTKKRRRTRSRKLPARPISHRRSIICTAGLSACRRKSARA
jgi:nucleotidyltransferase/DNA polymerase involved in DNA repair